MSRRKYTVRYQPVMAEHDVAVGTADTVSAARELARADMRANKRIPEGYSYSQRKKQLFPGKTATGDQA